MKKFCIILQLILTFVFLIQMGIRYILSFFIPWHSIERTIDIMGKHNYFYDKIGSDTYRSILLYNWIIPFIMGIILMQLLSLIKMDIFSSRYFKIGIIALGGEALVYFWSINNRVYLENMEISYFAGVCFVLIAGELNSPPLAAKGEKKEIA